MDNVFPIGKYRGQTLRDVRARDPSYLEWIGAQAWFVRRCPELAEKIHKHATNDGTPAHNRLQAMFLNKPFVARVIDAAVPEHAEARHEWETGVQFEVRGIDVLIDRSVAGVFYARLAVEIKPSIGDDYPAVMRQVLAGAARLAKCRPPYRNVIFAEQFSAAGVTRAQLAEILAHSGIQIIYLADVAANVLH